MAQSILFFIITGSNDNVIWPFTFTRPSKHKCKNKLVVCKRNFEETELNNSIRLKICVFSELVVGLFCHKTIKALISILSSTPIKFYCMSCMLLACNETMFIEMSILHISVLAAQYVVRISLGVYIWTRDPSTYKSIIGRSSLSDLEILKWWAPCAFEALNKFTMTCSVRFMESLKIN